MNLAKFIADQREWSKRTFGETPRTEGILAHIAKEMDEVRADPTDVTEWIDIVILALDGAWRAGHSPEEICQAMKAKQAKNFARTYPQTPDDQPSEHIKEEGEEQ